METKRVFLIVLDSFGIGHARDADKFNDEGSDTLGTIRRSRNYYTPNMERLGLFHIDGVGGADSLVVPQGAFGRMQEASKGKDTTIGHWEIAGHISKKPMPTYPKGFPDEIICEFEKRTGRKVLCNQPYSGSEVIKKYGKEHMRTGALIVYTSADSVFQIAAHEEIVPVEELYEYCRIARSLLHGEHGVGRVIARPFIGTEPDNFQRTRNRHDFSLIPPENMLNTLQEHGLETIGVGKIYDIFAGRGISETYSIKSNTDGMDQTIKIMEKDFHGLCFVNLVDFDMLYGNRNDIDGYAQAASDFDIQLGIFLNKMQKEDVLMITADHGCDPGYAGTDHTRECTPLLAYGKRVKSNCNLGTRDTFADIGATILEMLDMKNTTDGKSFLKEMERK